ncbi:MAG: flippase-like domain-containing protein [Vicinamibacteria bacterium]|nr:flippase-like domain-containing protein [Vicinamibacteria bacterium]
MSDAPVPVSSRRSRLLAWGFAIVLLGSLVFMLETLDLRRVLELVMSSHPGLLALAVLVNLTLNTYTRVRRRRVLLEAAARAAPELGLWDLTRLFFATYAANNLLPARAGDVLFAVEMKRRGFRLASVVAAQVSEKLIELASLWLLIPAALLLATVSPRMTGALYLFLALGAIGLALVVVFTRGGSGAFPVKTAPAETPRGTWPRLALRLRRSARGTLDSIRRIATPRAGFRALLWSCGQDASDVLMVGLVARAVDIHVGPGGWLLVYLAVNLASALPSTPGQLGLIEAGAVFALVELGVGANRSVAFALLYHLAHLIPITLLGLPLLLRLQANPPADALPAPSP